VKIAVYRAVAIYSILSFLQGKEMDVARHVIDTYFSDVTNVLVRHHLDSYADLLRNKIPNVIKGLNPVSLDLGDRRIEVYIGGKNGDDIRYLPPTDEFGNAILPHTCRLKNTTYSLKIQVSLDVEYTFSDGVVKERFEEFILGEIPLMLKSSLCYLSNMTSEQLYEAGECRFELGGYFIIDGQERVLLSQERLGENMFYATKRRRPPMTEDKKSFYEKTGKYMLEGSTEGEEYEYCSAIRSVSEDGARGPFSHFLTIPPRNQVPNEPDKILGLKSKNFADFLTRRLALIQLPGFNNEVPLFSVFNALGLTSDKDIYDTILAGIPEQERQIYDELFMELVLSHERFLQQELKKQDNPDEDPNMLVLYTQTRGKTKQSVYVNLFNDLFPHCSQYQNESPASFYRRKAYLLGLMTRMAMDVAVGAKPKTDREHYKFKRLYASGDLMFEEFRRVYKDLSKQMRTLLDSRVEFQRVTYEGKKLAEIILPQNLGIYWKSSSILDEFSKSFKGRWGGENGVSQVLTRYSYIGSIAHLRRVNVVMDKDTKLVEPRRIHGSSWGLFCPSDNPDGGNVGLIKSMALMATFSTASESELVFKLVRGFKHFTAIEAIHPSTWNPTWTKIFINSNLVGVCEKNTNEFHETLLKERRKGTLNKFVSLSWNHLDNEYNIYTDAGRPTRPIYREGTRETDVRKTKSWESMVEKLFDYVDASESDSIRISMTPCNEKRPSEIHGLAILSASTSIIPYSDHDPATRNAFTCQQAKQACSWFNTAFNKRFDTIATWLNYAGRSLTQTWTTNLVLGKDGCMPYGQTPIIAIATYTGHNQEDAVILNDNALKRGLFTITYYHGYDFQEEMKDTLSGTHTEFANVLTDPKYRESVERSPKYDYSKLGPDGIILKGAVVTDKTVLVGVVEPLRDASGQIKGYLDKSKTPKRGQSGFVDDVFVYEVEIAPRVYAKAVKIRVSENREPTLGDKFAARHGQKGTCGLKMAEEDLFYTASGICPDMIVNPHAIPSRMTIGMFVELLSSKLGLELGAISDATPFTTKNRLEETRSLMRKLGFEPHGNEIVYNGMNGEMIQAEIFMGPCFYVRVKQMVEDKINYRDTGPRKLLTHQPLEGRANDGGLKIGEMERDCLVSHGVSKFWNESMMERSDKEPTLFQPELGKFDANPEYSFVHMDVPYATRLFLNELQAMHIDVKLTTS
jgi:DNA-directed RNA polymerase II subunit RPB2